jgi:hypothetical protein
MVLEDAWENTAQEHYKDIKDLNIEIGILFNHARQVLKYLELATAAEDNKNRDRAWAFNGEASLLIGEALEKTAAIHDRIELSSKAKQNIVNAKGRNKAHLPVKEATIRLLSEMKPEGGWPTKTKAIKDLEKYLTEVIEKKEILTLDISNIDKWLTTWLRDDELVNAAWEKNKHANAR